MDEHVERAAAAFIAGEAWTSLIEDQAAEETSVRLAPNGGISLQVRYCDAAYRSPPDDYERGGESVVWMPQDWMLEHPVDGRELRSRLKEAGFEVRVVEGHFMSNRVGYAFTEE